MKAVRVVEYTLIDGYNLINSWPKLFNPASDSLDDMRDKLIALMADYQGYRGCEVILVFDAHFVKRGLGSEYMYGKLKVVFTREGYSADNYIERFVYKYASENVVRVVTADYLEQSIVLFSGGLRVTPEEFIAEFALMKNSARKYVRGKNGVAGRRGINSVMESMDGNVLDVLERLRLAD